MMYSNFNQEIWYTPRSQEDEQKPTRFLLKTIPYRFTSLTDITNTANTLPLREFIIKHCIIDFQNISTDLSKDEVLNNLHMYISKVMLDDIITKVLELWVPNPEFLKILTTTIELMVDNRFTDGTWNCGTCQKRGLDKQRNCPLIKGVEHLDPMFKLPFMDETITMCPIVDKDESLGRLLLEGYNFREINQLPEAGGMGDQPILFVIGTQRLAERIKYFTQHADEEALRSNK